MTLAPSSMRTPWLYHLELNRTPQEPTSLCNQRFERQASRGCVAEVNLEGPALRGALAGELGDACCPPGVAAGNRNRRVAENCVADVGVIAAIVAGFGANAVLGAVGQL